MTKLQMIKRSNGSKSYSVNIPLDMIRELEWDKGIDLLLEVEKVRDNFVIVVSNEKQTLEDNNG